jgi:uncharacterized OsmC-like protein
MPKLEFKFSGESKSATKFVGHSRNFQITIDEPAGLGGNDEAATPVEYTLASLAGCLNVVSYVIAKELNFTINSLKIDVSGELHPEKFLTGSNKHRAGFTSISANLHVDADASPEVLETWLKSVEERCPVTDNLANPTTMNITKMAYSTKEEITA